MAEPGSRDESSRTVILVPTRLAATRLPDKPLADIGGVPMIVHVWRRAREAGLGRVVVACAEEAVAAVVRAAGGETVLTDPALPSGSDRVFQALGRIDPERRFGRVINLQGDLPTLDPADLRRVVEPLDALGCGMATLAAPVHDEAERTSTAAVKAVISFVGGRDDLGRALYFTRAQAPWGPGPLYHHIGIYAFARPTLERFAALPPSPLEAREKLEQLRALEHGIAVGVAVVARAPFGVDTPADLERARLALRSAA